MDNVFSSLIAWALMHKYNFENTLKYPIKCPEGGDGWWKTPLRSIRPSEIDAEYKWRFHRVPIKMLAHFWTEQRKKLVTQCLCNPFYCGCVHSHNAMRHLKWTAAPRTNSPLLTIFIICGRRLFRPTTTTIRPQSPPLPFSTAQRQCWLHSTHLLLAHTTSARTI